MRSWKFLLALLLAATGGLQAQSTGRLTGTVTNEQGQAVASASVMVRGTRIGTLTGPDGKYVLPGLTAGTHTVVATLLGYGDATNEVSVAAGQTAVSNFRLTVKAVQLEGIVAVGYGTQQKRTVTGAQQTVKAQQLAEIATSNPVKALQGRVAGVEIVAQNNVPGAAMNIRVRGMRSLTASNDPLYVVDGIPLAAGGIADFNPADIQTIDVLKDAAATAIYGSAGANGVVLITTKTGSATGALKTQFTADVSTGFKSPLRLLDMMNMQQYVAMLQDAARYNGQSDALGSVLNSPVPQLAQFNAGQQTDWQDYIRRTGRQTNFQLGMSGITGTTRFNISGNYFKDVGISRGQDYSRATGSLSVDHTKGRLRLGVTANGSRSVQNPGPGDGLWGYALAQSGFGLPQDSTGAFVAHPDGEGVAVSPARALRYAIAQNTRYRLFGSAFADFQLLEGVNIRSSFGPDITNGENGAFNGPSTTYPDVQNSTASYTRNTNFVYTLNNTLTVNRDLGAAHHVDATLLYSIQKNTFTQENNSATNLPYDQQLWYNLKTGTINAYGSNFSERMLESYMGRLVYTFRDRYTVSGAVRRDGASVLAPGHQWTTFPSVGLAWQLGDEPFMKRFDWLSALKVRGSYGVSGNQSINPYQTQGALQLAKYDWNEANAVGFGPNPGNPANPNLSWEKTYQKDAAIDFGILANRITGSIDWYLQDTKDLLMNRNLPPTSGYTNTLMNIGSTRNTGVEVTLSPVILQNWHGLRWSADINWAHNHNEIVSLANADTTGCPLNARPCVLGNNWFVGQPISVGNAVNADINSQGCFGPPGCDLQRQVWYYYRMIGVWQQPDDALARSYGGGSFKAGQIRLDDVNGDGRISTADAVILGNTYAKWTGSLYNRFNFKSLDLSTLMTFRQGYTLFDQRPNQMYGRLGNIVTDYWTAANPINNHPAPSYLGQTIPNIRAQQFTEGSNMRITNITLGWTAPDYLAGRVAASSLRLYATAQDPFFFSKYKGYDPDNGTVGGTPMARTILFGANVGW